ncbi:DUF2911 domain-containing protein [Robiginitalea sp. IMCC43444]|uniref:DUF2911 domain-containing protein n=1 Tax=Robiginitalea sp. IMCC43444 TaxID=3459121 RepID=UPI004042D11D
MKRLTLFLFSVCCSLTGFAQIQTPQPSPAAEVQQAVGLTEVNLKYSRPAMRGRVIFGGLVPFDKVWRTGANANSTISFSDDVKIDGQEIKAGTYAIFTKPGKENWEVYFYSDTSNWGTPSSWDESKVAAKTTVNTQELNMPVESFTISIDAIHNNGATLGMAWDKTYVGVPFSVPTREKAMASIESAMAGPSGNAYYSAASYYYEEGLDMDKAKMWIDKAVETNPDAFWMSRRQSLIYAKMGDSKGAIAAAKKSLAAAKKAGNADYVKMNEDSLKEWGAM